MGRVDQLPLQRDRYGILQMAGYGPVNLRIDYDFVLAREPEGVVFKGAIRGGRGHLVKEVAVKMHTLVQDPNRLLRKEAEVHVLAWLKLGYVLSPLGFLAAHDKTGTPAILVLEIGIPFRLFLELTGPASVRHEEETRAVARVVSQLLRVIVAGDAINMVHNGIDINNMYVRNAQRPETAELAMGAFGAAKRGRVNIDGSVTYDASEYTWSQTSPRMASVIYEKLATHKIERENVHVDRQLIFYNELFSWARVAFQSLADRRPPDILYGPSRTDYAQVPGKGKGEVVDATRHLLKFALDLLSAGTIDEVVDSKFVNSLDWYSSIPAALKGDKE